MNFLNPAILFGLFAASIPLILHLLNLRKQKKIEFSTLKFLKELQKSKIRKIKIKQIILLILRTLLVIFIVMAFARPVIESSLPYFTSYSNTSAVIILDNSFSTDASDEYGNRFRQSKNIANSIVEQMKEGDEISLITLNDLDGFYNSNMSRDFDLIKDKIINTEISTKQSNLKGALTLANKQLSESINLNKDIFFVTDGQKNIVNELSDTNYIIEEKLGFMVAKVGRNSDFEINNYSIDSLDLISQIYVKDKVIEVELGIKNNTNKDLAGLIVSLSFNGERAAQKSIDIKANKIEYLIISASIKDVGIIEGLVSIESDAIVQDNKRHFAFIVPKPPKVALIQDTEDVFLDVLLNKLSNNSYDLHKFTTNQSGRINLSQFDNVYLVNGNYPKTLLNRLELFVQGGGNLFSFASSDNNNDFNIFMKKMGLELSKISEFNSPNPINFSTIDKFHPIFDGVFKGTTNSKAIVESPDIYKIYPSIKGRVIINTQAGAFLSESRYGGGKVMYCAVGSDLEWSNFPLTGIYPSLIHRSISYLASGSEASVFANSGERIIINIPQKKSGNNKFKIIDPNGKVFFKQSVKLSSNNILSFDDLEITGVYKIYNSKGDAVSSIAVNHFKKESEQAYLTDETFGSILEKQFKEESAVEFLEDLGNINQEIIRAKLGTELWKIFVLLAIIVALVEMLVQRVSKNEVFEG